LRPQIRQSFARAQTLDLGEREIFGEPTAHRFTVDDLHTPAHRKLRMLRNVRRTANFIFVPRDQDAIARHDQIGFDVIRALLDCQAIRFDGVFGPFTAGTAVRNYNNLGQRAPALPSARL
jgi:hypothetical protein